MIPQKINLLGFSFSRTVFALIALGAVFILFKIGAFLKNMFADIGKMLGFGDDSAQEKNLESIAKEMAKDPAIKSQMNLDSKQCAESIFNALNQLGWDEDLLVKTFAKITGPSKMKAVYLAFDKRSMFVWPFNISGDLSTVVRKRLLDYDLKKKRLSISTSGQKLYWTIEKKLSWIS